MDLAVKLLTFATVHTTAVLLLSSVLYGLVYGILPHTVHMHDPPAGRRRGPAAQDGQPPIWDWWWQLKAQPRVAIQ